MRIPLFVIVLALANFLVPLNSTMIVVALPTVARDLAVEPVSLVPRLLADYRDRVRQEPGNVAFTPGADRDDPTSFWVYEEYADAAAFQAHLESAHNEEFNRAVGPHLHGGTSRLRMLTPLPREDADG